MCNVYIIFVLCKRFDHGYSTFIRITIANTSADFIIYNYYTTPSITILLTPKQAKLSRSIAGLWFGGMISSFFFIVFTPRHYNFFFKMNWMAGYTLYYACLAIDILVLYVYTEKHWLPWTLHVCFYILYFCSTFFQRLNLKYFYNSKRSQKIHNIVKKLIYRPKSKTVNLKPNFKWNWNVWSKLNKQ